ncbi:hypothetical protein [Nocardioides humi]|uniref:Transmembrane protein n=1 Tax=Nocardioides humi TaxID=449461 RepID=A0ABN2AKB6_9ACTN|nr:hypothetical protein [Nocardioides humi]
MRSRRRPSLTTRYLIAIAAFLVAFATFAITITVLSPDDQAAQGRSGGTRMLGIAVRTLFLTDGSDASPTATALLLPLAWASLVVMVSALLTCISINIEYRRGGPYR